ncbi:protease modulator HflK [Croceicoccus naphthovorans]|uniref:Peptidase n=1 Tax=Croceicoccus naphthovorans TaxID=1348774 RepID=A0A0G3XEB5_9SPHN|nr:protease modulator HflK [Croceicoccus naphthovorans]AKM08986.1 peptidase [Croceicoccus naphthovorans]MBB3989205.1 membrane protease subunit HflK [Croceicoccus naphthovorans]
MAGKSPWGSNPGPRGGNEGGEGDDPAPEETPSAEGGNKPRNPWLPGDGEDGPRRAANIEDLFKHRQARRGGGGGGGNFPRMPQAPGGKSWAPLIAIGVIAGWFLISSVHQIGPKEEGIVTTAGQYSRTMTSGLKFSLPWPIQSVEIEDVTSIRTDTIPEGEAEKLMLTGDQNLVDLSYIVRWNIKDLKLYTFQIGDPDNAVKEVAEAAMRASIAEVTLDDALSGSGRAQVEQSVRTRMQALLDAYGAGIAVQGVEIKKADPPEAVVNAFREVLAAQQDAQSDINRARAWAEQVTARAEGEAEAFDKVYAEYRLAPEVTKRRMYYETMERVLSKTDKTIIEADGVVPYLPLPEVNRRASSNSNREESE